MNSNIFNVVWNKVLKLWVVASELAKNKQSSFHSIISKKARELPFAKSILAGTISLLLLNVPSFGADLNLAEILDSGVTEKSIDKGVIVRYKTDQQLEMNNQKLTLHFSGSSNSYTSWKFVPGSPNNSVNLRLVNKSELISDGEFRTYVDEPSNDTFYTQIDDSTLTVNSYLYVGEIFGTRPIEAEYNNFVLEVTNNGIVNTNALVMDYPGTFTLENSVLNAKKTRRNTVESKYDYRDDLKGTIVLKGNSKVIINDLNYVKDRTNWDSYSDISNENLHLKTMGENNEYNFLAGRLTAFTANPDFNAKFVLGSNVDVPVGENGVKPYSAILRLYRNEAYGSVDILMHDSSLIELMGDGSGGEENPIQSKLSNGLVGSGQLNVRNDYLFDRAQDQFDGLVHIMKATEEVRYPNASGKEILFDFAHSAGTAKVAVDDALGVAGSTVINDHKLVFVDGKISRFVSDLEGEGVTEVGDNRIEASGNHDQFTGLLDLNNANGSWNVDRSAGDYNINYAFTGTGTMNIGTQKNIIFNNTTKGDDFTGTFNVTKGILNLDETAFSILTDASLGLVGGQGNLYTDNKELVNLTFEKGAMYLDPNDSQPQLMNHLKVSGEITLIGDQNLIKVDPDKIPKNSIKLEDIDQKISFLDQQLGENGETLISGKTVVYDNEGNINHDFESIFLADKDGKLIESKDIGQSTALIQNDSGKAYYGFNGLKTDDKGIHLNYGLDEIEAFKDKNVLVLSDLNNVTTNSRDLRVELVGEGGFIFKGSEAITLSGNENSYTGNTLIDGASVTAGMNNVFGKVGNLTISNKGNFDLSGKSQIVDTLAISDGSTLDVNKGDLTVRQSSTLKGGTLLGVTGNFIFDGKTADDELTIEGGHSVGINTTVQNGRMNIVKDAMYGNGEGTVTIADKGILGGYGSLKGDLLLQGELNVGSTMSRNIGGALGNFTVNGNFKAEEGSLIRIASDGKEAGRLVITGNAEGKSLLQVNDMQGQDLIQLADGTRKVEVVTIDGDVNTLELKQKGRAAHGAYDYFLVKEKDGNWWLVNDIDGNGSGDNGDEPILRPETAVYTAGLDTANRLFAHQLSDRNYLDPSSRLWTIVGGDFSKAYDRNKGNKVTVDSFRMMIGGDLIKDQIGEDTPITFGLFAAYGHSSIDAKQQRKPNKQDYYYSAKGRSNGFGVGAYVTLGDQLKEGAYFDSYLQYVNFRNKVSGEGLQDETMKIRGFIGSVETGYTWQLDQDIYLQPQAQLTWMGAHMKRMTDHSGTHITGSENNLETRLGARLFMEKTLENGHKINPYLEVNYYHNSKPFYTSFDGEKAELRGMKNVGEIKAGVEGEVKPGLNLWGGVGYRSGSHSYRDISVSFGLRYHFEK